eukprot:702423-Alexandrium_andersonii.AAC.1
MPYTSRRPFSAALTAYRRAATTRRSWKPSACSTSCWPSCRTNWPARCLGVAHPGAGIPPRWQPAARA